MGPFFFPESQQTVSTVHNLSDRCETEHHTAAFQVCLMVSSYCLRSNFIGCSYLDNSCARSCRAKMSDATIYKPKCCTISLPGTTLLRFAFFHHSSRQSLTREFHSDMSVYVIVDDSDPHLQYTPLGGSGLDPTNAAFDSLKGWCIGCMGVCS